MSDLVGAFQFGGESGEEPGVRLSVRLTRFRPSGFPAGYLDAMNTESVGHLGLREIPR